MAEPKITPKKICFNCHYFKPRDPDEPWPIAGVPKSAEGKCGFPTLTRVPNWRRTTDSCHSFKLNEKFKKS